jgi:Tfp pilus assembly ATPase PilU
MKSAETQSRSIEVQCPHCKAAMRFVRRIDVNGLPNIHVFYCRESQRQVALHLSGQLHQHLSQILALEQFEKGRRRILDAMLDGFLPRQLAFAYPP